jgi:hypothetical protein
MPLPLLLLPAAGRQPLMCRLLLQQLLLLSLYWQLMKRTQLQLMQQQHQLTQLLHLLMQQQIQLRLMQMTLRLLQKTRPVLLK